MTTLYDKIANLPPELLPKVEHFVDSLPEMDGEWELPPVYDANGKRVDLYDDDGDWEQPLYDVNGKKIHPQPGCLKGLIVMHDDFFDTDEDDDWDQYV